MCLRDLKYRPERRFFQIFSIMCVILGKYLLFTFLHCLFEFQPVSFIFLKLYVL